MNSAAIKELLKTIAPNFEKFYAGKLDNKFNKSLCVYSLETKTRLVAIGGKETTKTKNKNFSILIHWNGNYTETETVANELYDKISEIKQTINYNNKNYVINYIEMLKGEPIDLHCDDNGIYERLIDISIYYNE